MEATLRITVRQISAPSIKEALATLEAIKHDHPDLFQQAEVVIDVCNVTANYLPSSGKE